MNGQIYDASLDRFMSVDPLIAQTANLQNYIAAYVSNNPLSYTDLRISSLQIIGITNKFCMGQLI